MIRDGKGGEDGKDAEGAHRWGRVWRGAVSVFSVFSVLSVPAQAQSIAKRLDARLDRPPFNRQLWGVALVDQTGRLVYGRNADRPFIPASN
ncbi:MAG: hypothetical protein M3Q37_12855, partial [Gemmatimonadota bacterium]|nr:hypothetical protein [Gemmatimonadota bacterium]